MSAATEEQTRGLVVRTQPAKKGQRRAYRAVVFGQGSRQVYYGHARGTVKQAQDDLDAWQQENGACTVVVPFRSFDGQDGFGS